MGSLSTLVSRRAALRLDATTIVTDERKNVHLAASARARHPFRRAQDQTEISTPTYIYFLFRQFDVIVVIFVCGSRMPRWQGRTACRPDGPRRGNASPIGAPTHMLEILNQAARHGPNGQDAYFF